MSLAKQCAEFVRWAMQEGAWTGSELDGGDIQAKAVSLGLLKVEPYDPEKHGESEYDVEPGDDWYTLADGVQELLKS